MGRNRAALLCAAWLVVADVPARVVISHCCLVYIFLDFDVVTLL
jgi:hypothetical protein